MDNAKKRYDDTIRELMAEKPELKDFVNGAIVAADDLDVIVLNVTIGKLAILKLTCPELGHLYGRVFGFPQCCINAMEEEETHWNHKASKVDFNHEIVQQGHGYVPCIECAKLTTAQLVDKITERRLFGLPFPLDDMGGKHAQAHQFIGNIDKVPKATVSIRAYVFRDIK